MKAIMVLLSFCFLNCSPHSHKSIFQIPVEKLQLNIPKNATDKIVFLTFKIELEDSATDKHILALVNSTLADGKLKVKS